ncbi:hypothetical protein [Streptomyces sp. NPDC091259]|uniref:arsenate reductase/protein-tyrosine-phosphatase family protein n=1 Tax=Streptomyces sp. NPDC091259 TaxID=3365976 RepID=UPI0038305939
MDHRTRRQSWRRARFLRVARWLGLDLTAHRGRQITVQDLEWADDVLAMDAAVLDTLHAIDARNTHKLRLYLADRDVPDPMSQDENTFNECAMLIKAGTTLHIGGHRS